MTKQFGKLKLHISGRGLAYKWGDGDIKRFSFPFGQGSQAGDANVVSGEGYAQGDYAHDQGYYRQDDGYADPSYSGNHNYGAEQGYYDDGQMGGDSYSGKYEFLYQNDWVMWALLVLLPPLGIWILWKRNRFDLTVRAAISAVSAIWFIIMLVWLFSALFSGRQDAVNANLPTGNAPAVTVPAPTDNVEAGLTPTLDPNAELDLTTNTPTDPVNNQNVGTGNTGNTGNTTPSGDDGTAGDQEVYATALGAYYHKTATCTRIVGTAQPITLSLAKQQGKSACETCYGETGTGGTTEAKNYYATKTGKYYHVTKNCSGMKGASKVTLAQAKKDGKGPCPNCIGIYYMTKTGKYYHKDKNCSGMQGAKRVTNAEVKASKKPACPKCLPSKKKTSTSSVTYYSKVGGTYYHTKSNCSGMTNPDRVTLAVAAQRKQKPCPTCVKKAASKTTYYATKSGKYYHTKQTCSGMKNASKITLTAAKKAGKKPCPECVKKAATSKATTYYATSTGKYYHKNKTCQGMKNAKKITLTAAKNRGLSACPTCLPKTVKSTYVYMNPNGTYYHSKSNCQGMKGEKRITLAAAKKAGGKACPYCMKTTYYYTTTANKYYHTKSGCMNMKNATKVTLVSAKAKGKTACPICVTKKVKAADYKSNTYVVTGGRYYHKDRTCGGMKNAKKVTLAAAKLSGKTACPTCVLKKATATVAADRKVSCYLIKNATYYHSTKKCAMLKGKKGIVKTSVATAKSHNHVACPDCVGKKLKTYVYVVPAGLLYHRVSTCSGMKNPMKLTLQTALDRKYKRCTKCNAPASK